MADFPILYGDASTGKKKQWYIRVFERDGTGIIETSHGYVDGKIQVNEKVISEGKNIGKKNETTPLVQAVNQARALWQKKRDDGYAPEGDDAESVDSGRAKEVFEDAPSPMLAHDYNKRGKSISFPCYVQRKYDGTRCVGVSGAGLFSRNRKRYPNLGHILEELGKLPVGTVLDGELYSDELTFQEIVGLVKRETLKAGDDVKQLKIKYHVYDIINDAPYEDRYASLQMMFKRYRFQHIVPVKTEMCKSEGDMKRLHADYVAEGYEGIMLRNCGAKYKVGTRSTDLQKYKEFFDAEYEVVGYKEGEGLEEGCVLWICKTTEGKMFSCRPRGSREERQSMFRNGGKYVGKNLTVRYQEMTDDNMPRFPVGIAFRDYE
jgi:ATP-dependent DNA ligase